MTVRVRVDYSLSEDSGCRLKTINFAMTAAAGDNTIGLRDAWRESCTGSGAGRQTIILLIGDTPERVPRFTGPVPIHQHHDFDLVTGEVILEPWHVTDVEEVCVALAA